MGVSPVRFAVAASGGLACLMLGLVAGVRVGTNETTHVVSVQTVTRTAGGVHGADAAARTVTRTVAKTARDPVTVTETETVTVQGPAARASGPKPPDGHGHHRPGDGPGDGGGDGGGDGR